MNPVNTKPYQLPADATWFITGCSSGIGRAIAELVASKAGQRLIATARNPSSLSYLPDNDSILKLTLDVASPVSVGKAFKAAADHFGDKFHIDILVNNAGYELAGDTEAATEEEMHDQLETNFFGTVRVATNATRVMRQSKEHRGGIIFNISSLAGVAAFPGQAFYHASKFAVEGWSESFARELHPDWNINICVVEPGGVKTEFEHGSKKHIKVHEAYDGADMPARQLAAWVKKAAASGGGTPPSAVAGVLYLVASRNDKVPLWLPLTTTAAQLIKMKSQARLDNLEAVKDLTPIDKK
ncbi:NAD(P)-binding protein [Cryphonectria parasitica EP155]|uniref:NAD(P)-binding protein n=1 Tax=Cryphonectria parasitica (strain ATCC 38755 / EP155) TaxID=660469 RepID=A0A9P4Y292_CRYP1|nr:NAD(P)-binding protein [Cryphonectria parasitica EP155]KAF3765313.1 NAD(P)-binding protein [Cryphonectria parasitica EP155]